MSQSNLVKSGYKPPGSKTYYTSSLTQNRYAATTKDTQAKSNLNAVYNASASNGLKTNQTPGYQSLTSALQARKAVNDAGGPIKVEPLSSSTSVLKNTPKTTSSVSSGRQVSNFVNTAQGAGSTPAPEAPVTNIPDSSSGFDVSDSSASNGWDLDKYLNGLQEQIELAHSYDLQNMEWSANEASKNRDWQAEMSNTAHQREVKDLIAAGLNPVLSAKYGGASTPTGSSAAGLYNTTSGVISGVTTSAAGMSNADKVRRTALDQMQNSKEVAYIQGFYGLSSSQIMADASISNAQLQYVASLYSTDVALQNGIRQLEGQKYSADSATGRQILQNQLELYLNKQNLDYNYYKTNKDFQAHTENLNLSYDQLNQRVREWLSEDVLNGLQASIRGMNLADAFAFIAGTMSTGLAVVP